MLIDSRGWRERCHMTHDPRPSDTGLWVFVCFEGRLTLSTDGRYDSATDQLRKLLDGRRPQDVSVN